MSRDNFLRAEPSLQAGKIGLGWVNFQVLRQTQASLGHKEGIDPKVAADQRGHAIGVAADTYTITDLEAVTKLSQHFTTLGEALQLRKADGSGFLR
jgi:hypothetical protein